MNANITTQNTDDFSKINNYYLDESGYTTIFSADEREAIKKALDVFLNAKINFLMAKYIIKQNKLHPLKNNLYKVLFNNIILELYSIFFDETLQQIEYNNLEQSSDEFKNLPKDKDGIYHTSDQMYFQVLNQKVQELILLSSNCIDLKHKKRYHQDKLSNLFTNYTKKLSIPIVIMPKLIKQINDNGGKFKSSWNLDYNDISTGLPEQEAHSQIFDVPTDIDQLEKIRKKLKPYRHNFLAHKTANDLDIKIFHQDLDELMQESSNIMSTLLMLMSPSTAYYLNQAEHIANDNSLKNLFERLSDD